MLRDDTIYFITSRTVDGRLFLRPSDEVNNAIGAAVAEAQERFEVEIFDFVFVSNHFHLAARSKSGQLSPFLQYVKANVARFVNRTLGRRGTLWESRFKASAILDEGALVERAIYIYGHGVKEGLVDRSHEWPGVASVKERLSGESVTYERFDQAGFTRDQLNRKEALDRAEYTREVSIQLSPWPFLEGLSEEAARIRVQGLVDIAESRAREARRGRPALGVAFVLAQDPWSVPVSKLQRTPQPLCHATSRGKEDAYRAAYASFVADYRVASKRFRAGELRVRFPRYSLPPPLPPDWIRTSAAR